MENRIRRYVEQAFADVPQTQRVRETQEELILNLIEKYHEQMDKGSTSEQAYNTVITGIGDIQELVDSVRPQAFSQPTEKQRKKSALLLSLSVMLYILSPCLIILFDTVWGWPEYGVIAMFILIAAATGLIIYNYMSKPRYIREDDTMVERYKEQTDQQVRRRSAYNSFKSAYWTLVVLVYLSVSFFFGIWAFSWLIFIMAAAIEQIIRAIVRR